MVNGSEKIKISQGIFPCHFFKQLTYSTHAPIGNDEPVMGFSATPDQEGSSSR
jgi:hypothetical protein